MRRNSFSAHALALFGACGASLLVIGLASSRKAEAVPSYARQTGQPCATCHNGVFPQLTPYGRQFKLNGYTAGGTRCRDTDPVRIGAPGEEWQVPLSVMLQTTYTHTQKALGALPTNRDGFNNGLRTNDNAFEQDTSLFVAGQLYCKLGAFVQITYDRNDEAYFLDNTDIRYADHARVAGLDVVYGLSANNNPTVEDLWNTTPAWRIPGGGSLPSVFAPGYATPLIENLGATVAGGVAYTMINNSLYLAFGLYDTLNAKALQTTGNLGSGFGTGLPGSAVVSKFDGLAPYWRAAYEKNIGPFTFEVGTFGLAVSQKPDVTQFSPSDKYTDIGFDLQFQYLNGPHFVTVRASHIYEWQKLNGSGPLGLGGADNVKNHLSDFNASVTYAYDSRYSATLGYFETHGSTDFTLYNGGFASSNGSPNSRGFVVDLGYSPWNKGGPSFYPWLNTRLGVQYYNFTKLNGASTNYDSAGRNVTDDNTLLLYSWTAF